MRFRAILLATAFVFLGLVYSLPQIRHAAFGARGAILLYDDETSYGARLRRAMEGNAGIGNPWVTERAGDRTIIPALPENLLAALPYVLRKTISPGAVIIVSRAVFPGLTFLLLTALLRAFGFGRAAAPFFSFWLVGEPGLIALKPFAGLFLGASALPLARFLNPLVNLPLFLLATLLAAHAFQRRRVQSALLAGAATGLLFHVSIYYWTHLVVSLLLFALISRAPQRWKTLALGALGAAAVAFPYLLEALRLRSDPFLAIFSWRNGLFLAERGTYLLGHKALWIFFALGVPVFFQKNEKDRFLSALVLGGMACYFSSLATGVTLQNFHWLYTLAPFLLVAAARGLWISGRFLPRIQLTPATVALIPKKFSTTATVFLALLLAANPLRAVQRWIPSERLAQASTLGRADQPYFEAWHWLSRNADPRSVILASGEIMELAPFRSGVRSLASYHLLAEPMPNPEILERFQAAWLVEGISAEELEKRISPPSPPPIAQWVFGMTPAQEAAFREENFPPLSFDRLRKLAREIAALQTSLEKQGSRQLLAGFRLDWLVIGPREKAWEERATKLFRLGTPIVAGEVRIYPIHGILPP